MRKLSGEIIIDVHNLTKKFGTFTAVNNISFQVNKGEIFGFLGANGAGKTTAIRILCGLSMATSGTLIIGGIDVNKNPEKLKRNIGYMSQKFSLYEDLTVYENIRFFGGIYDIKKEDIEQRAYQLMNRLNLLESSKSLISGLPLGWKQKLAFSVAILHNPIIVFLDEPTGGVDPITRRQFWDLIYEASENGITIFVTTHYMDEAEYCDRLSIMVEGRIEELDTPEQLKVKYNASNMDDVFVQVARKKLE